MQHRQNLVELHRRLRGLHPADVAHILESLPIDDRLVVWRELTPALAGPGARRGQPRGPRVARSSTPIARALIGRAARARRRRPALSLGIAARRCWSTRSRRCSTRATDPGSSRAARIRESSAARLMTQDVLEPARLADGRRSRSPSSGAAAGCRRKPIGCSSSTRATCSIGSVGLGALLIATRRRRRRGHGRRRPAIPSLRRRARRSRRPSSATTCCRRRSSTTAAS